MTPEQTADGGLIDVVDELEDLVASARRVPLSASVIVNEDEVLELIDRVRLGLPEELAQARHALEDRERLLGAAEAEAEQVLARADEEAARRLQQATERAAVLVDDHAVTHQAEARAAELVAAAEQQASAVRGEADAYARKVMGLLEDQLTQALTTVRRGLASLAADTSSRGRGQRAG